MAEAGGSLAVLVMAYGGPGKIDDVEPYLQDIRGGRPTRPQLVEEIRARYARIGGRSPILELTRAQAAAIGRKLGARYRVFVGMRHWHPYIRDTVGEIKRAGHRRLIGVVMAPHDSSMSIGAYEKKLLEATGGGNRHRDHAGPQLVGDSAFPRRGGVTGHTSTPALPAASGRPNPVHGPQPAGAHP